MILVVMRMIFSLTMVVRRLMVMVRCLMMVVRRFMGEIFHLVMKMAMVQVGPVGMSMYKGFMGMPMEMAGCDRLFRMGM
jgi:hypothetical protein